MSPRKRARYSRVVQYGVLVVIVVAVVMGTDWSNMREQVFNLEAVQKMASDVPYAFVNTVKYTASAFAVALALGLVLALMKLSSVRLYRIVATGYVEFFRGVPALLVVLAFAYIVPVAFQVRFSSVTVTIALALGMVSAAYLAETLRAGLQAVPKGQVEAARSLGMTSGQTMRSVVIPQAFRMVLPPVTNEIVLLTKDTSLIYVMGLAVPDYDLTRLARYTLNNVAVGGLTAFVVVGIAYLMITIPLSALTRWLERKTGSKGHV
ncbi:amino acid ABC transporter permease [Isoptericola sp. b441]|uniref:Amino acid ABC transporter permease n=2 Tax=Actinotalea lenta TaxID=3064654 RepID=A0ABT9D8R7_9CELL|nr:amino acid ABC transporter permease [Isoptericola sp. b441]MDO8107281.1 amino acid ABC transporter permease [Isoptericola sp. b441]MDO8121057.1 amino acid ABC transporter permease [Isoptericola sp. b490]